MTKVAGTSALVDVYGYSGQVEEPNEQKKDVGFQDGERPPHEYLNWLFSTTALALNHVLQNGVAEWNTETAYAAGNLTKHNGGLLYKALLDNQGAEPPLAGSNIWARALGGELASSIGIDTAMGSAKFRRKLAPNVASAASINLGAIQGNIFTITGAASISAFTNGAKGDEFNIRFSGALSLVNSDDLILPGTANIQTSPGDRLWLTVIDDVGTCEVTYYVRADGRAVVTPATAQPGDIKMFGGLTTETGWYDCIGTSLLRASEPALYASIGTAFGAIDSDHFNVPDMRGVFPRGYDGTANRDPDRGTRIALLPGGATGNNIGSYQADQIKAHDHVFTGSPVAGHTHIFTGSPVSNHAHTLTVSDVVGDTPPYFAGAGGAPVQQRNPGNRSLSTDPAGGHTPAGSLSTAGGFTPAGVIGQTGGNETRPKNVYLRFLIKA